MTANEKFYLSCTLGFEKFLAVEIAEVWPWLIGFDNQPNQQPVPTRVLDHGGVAIECEYHLGIQLNFFLKTANRVLWRVAEFKSRDFPKLYEKISRIEWTRFLKSSQVEWVVAASGSRLNHEKRIEATCAEALQKAFAKSPVAAAGSHNSSEKPVQKIYVRMKDDLCTVSLDTSGEHLHKRGWGAFKGNAPLRETLSAFLLREMMAGASVEELQSTTLVDPMCGSGTLLLEGASLLQPVFEREFSFLNWKNTPKIYSTPLWKKNYKKLFTVAPFKAFKGYDVEPKVLSAAKENLQSLREKSSLKNLEISFQQEDLFSGDKIDIGKNWCVLNPPYGERLKVQTTASAKAEDLIAESFSYQELLQRIADKFNSEKIGVLLPQKSHVKALTAPQGYKKSVEFPFNNGGLDVVYLIFAR